MNRPAGSSRRAEVAAFPRAVATLGVLGLVAAIVPYAARGLGLEVDVAASVEVVDHVVPGLAVVLGAALLLVAALRDGLGPIAPLAGPGLCFLGGLWITTTHAPLVLDASDGRVAWDAALFHTATGPLILLLSAWVIARQLSARPKSLEP